MSEINSILRQLWDDVYVKSNMHGNDIEWIEIRAEASEGAETKRNTRAKYNYRVVMKCTDNRQEVRQLPHLDEHVGGHARSVLGRSEGARVNSYPHCTR